MFADRDRHERTAAHALALDCLQAGVEAALPDRAVERCCAIHGGSLRVGEATYDLSGYDEVVVLGGGKAADGLAAALESLLDRPLDGAVVTHEPTADPEGVDVLLGDHPTPGPASVEATEAVLDRARSADGDALVLAAVTGGGSALLCAPAGGLAVDDVAEVTRELLDAGAPIEDVNTVRRACSRIKGGGLAAAVAPATVVGVVVSDVVGDDPALVASGPTVPVPPDPEAALAALDRHGVAAPAVRGWLRAAADGALDRYGTASGRSATGAADADTHVVASNRGAVAAAAVVAAERGYEPCVLSTRVTGEASEAGRFHAAVASEVVAHGDPVDAPAVLLSGGETTVTVTGDGVGGPNLTFALAGALDLPSGAVLAAVDTDGADGSTDAAGALVDAGTVDDPDAARAALADDDSYTYMDSRRALLETGPTGTNVDDLRVVVVDPTRF